jgi:peroxiredoxin
MAVIASTMLPLGTSAPHFNLPDTQGKLVSIDDFADAKALLIVFMCNHCPFVMHILKDFVKLVKDYQPKGAAVVGISSNDVESFPDDSPPMMAKLTEQMDFTFPYLYDEHQEVAKKYHAACTPDFFLFDKERKLVYRGQMDDSRPGNNIPITGADLRAALNAVLTGTQVSKQQKPSMGCSIKWKAGNEPDYMK